MRYLVLQDVVLPEFNLQLLAGDLLDEDALEPDVWPGLLSRGIVQDADAPVMEEAPDFMPDEPETDDIA